MDIATAIKTCLLEKYATFQGRGSRAEYWWFVLAYVFASLVVWLVTRVTGFGALQWIFVLALLSPALAAGFRRLQDTGRPGWYFLIPAGLSILTTLVAPAPMEVGQDGIPTELPSLGSTIFFGLLSLVQIVLTLLFLWWLTRPSQPETNAYGPPPLA